jgi:hypothetical protein
MLVHFMLIWLRVGLRLRFARAVDVRSIVFLLRPYFCPHIRCFQFCPLLSAWFGLLLLKGGEDEEEQAKQNKKTVSEVGEK